MTDRRAKAFTVLDEWDVIGGVLVGDSHRWLVALRGVLERHYEERAIIDLKTLLPVLVCHTCGQHSPCPDETAVINAVLGAPDG